MKKRIYITESQFRMLMKEQDELTFYAFYNDVLDFIKVLRQSPSTAKVSEKLTANGISREKLIKSLIENGVLSRKQNKPIEVESEDGKKKAKWIVKYDFTEKTKQSESLETVLKTVFDSLYKINESTDIETVDEEEDIEECTAAGAANGAGGTWMGDASYTVPFMGDKETTNHSNLVRRSTYKPKTKTNESIEEGSDRSQYWKDRWAKQKADGTVPNRSEYWKERAKKQKAKRSETSKPKRKLNKGYRDYIERLRDEENAMNMMSDNDWGEYFGDHD